MTFLVRHITTLIWPSFRDFTMELAWLHHYVAVTSPRSSYKRFLVNSRDFSQFMIKWDLYCNVDTIHFSQYVTTIPTMRVVFGSQCICIFVTFVSTMLLVILWIAKIDVLVFFSSKPKKKRIKLDNIYCDNHLLLFYMMIKSTGTERKAFM